MVQVTISPTCTVVKIFPPGYKLIEGPGLKYRSFLSGHDKREVASGSVSVYPNMQSMTPPTIDKTSTLYSKIKSPVSELAFAPYSHPIVPVLCNPPSIP